VGWSNKRLASGARRGLFRQPFRNVLVVVAAQGSTTDDWAALLAAGPSGVLVGWSAARLLDIEWRERPHGPPCVGLPRSEHRRLDDVVVLRRAIPDVDVVAGAGSLRRTSRARTVVDCLRLSPRVHRERMLDTALLRGWLTVGELATQVTAVCGQRGTPDLVRLLVGVSGGARSRAERVAQQLLARSGLAGWEWNMPVTLLDGSTAVVDAALPHLKIAVEIDGRAYHVDADRFQHDRTRQNGLVALGWIVLRFTWWDTRRPGYVLDAVRRAAVTRAA
jgi:very-short-patch-repair endonuclease